MGLFGSLFEKKACDICGGEIGLLGNRKLEDGNMCKKCAAKLSVWFSDRRSSTVEDILAQLSYREENKAAVAAFNTSRRFGSYRKVLIDDEAGKFMVVRTDNIEEENPDVIDLAAITGCEPDIKESRSEITRTVDGKQESYNPPRFRYSYEFDMLIYVRHPYFDEMRFDLKSGYVTVEDSSFGLMSRSLNPRANREYMEYEKLAFDIRDALLNPLRPAPVQQTVPVQQAAPVQSAIPKFCPECGSPTEGGKFCQNCGTKLVP